MSQDAVKAGIAIMEADMFCIWFRDMTAAHEAFNQLVRMKIIKDETDIVYLKEMMSPKCGWGFKDHETGTMAKLAVGG